MKAFVIGFLVMLVLFFLMIGLSAAGVVNWFVNDPERGAIKVAQDEFNAQTLLHKYEWFKDAAAQLDKKKADIEIYQGRLDKMDKKYGDREMPRAVQEQYNVWTVETAGVKASYNGLAAEYNAQMAKFNWRFTNAGSLPQGATEPLPREFRTYEEK